MVALIVGGADGSLNEIYSPNGRCSLALARAQIAHYLPILGFINGKITYCGGYYENRLNNIQELIEPIPSIAVT
jgi:hypothetical protein